MIFVDNRELTTKLGSLVNKCVKEETRAPTLDEEITNYKYHHWEEYESECQHSDWDCPGLDDFPVATYFSSNYRKLTVYNPRQNTDPVSWLAKHYKVWW